MGSCNSTNFDADAQNKALKKSLSKIKNKFIVMSGKGGVGKTSTSVNLAIALADKGFNVGLMDVDIHGPDIPHMLGLTEMLSMNSNEKLVPLNYSSNLHAVSIESLCQNKDDAIIWRGPVKSGVITQFLTEVEWGNLDFLIVDSPPGTGDEPMTVAQNIPEAKAILVTTPQEISLADVRKSINFCKTIKMEIFGIIENMSGFVCPHCNTNLDLFGTGGGEKTAINFNIPFLGKIPFDTQMVICGDQGISFQSVNNDSVVSKAFQSIADQIISIA